jgi:probable HAF family extracellular repeat protein
MKALYLIPMIILAGCADSSGLPQDPAETTSNIVAPSFVPLPIAGAIWSAAYGVSSNAWVAGELDVSDVEWHAARWRVNAQTGAATLEDLGDLHGRITIAFDVNTSGVVVGGSEEAAFGFGPGPDEAFVYRNGVMETLPTLGGPGGFARRINNSGWITGFSDAKDGTSHPVVWQPNEQGDYTVIDLGSLGGTDGWGNTITDDGKVVGLNETREGAFRAWYWGGSGPLTYLPSLSQGGANYAVDLNARGLIVGNGTDAYGFNHATIWRNGAIHDIHRRFPGMSYSFATAINAEGWIAVDAFTDDFTERAFAAKGDRVIDLGAAAGTSGGPYDINDRGWVAGTAVVGGVNNAALWFLHGSAALRADNLTSVPTPLTNPTYSRAKALMIRRLLAGIR